MVLTQSNPEFILKPLSRLGYREGDLLVARVEPTEIPDYLQAADVAISFIKPSFSKQASSPTKIAEYLGCGLPVICNKGVGDLDELISANEIGVLLPELNEACYEDGIREMGILRENPNLKQRCLDAAARLFDLVNVGGKKYERLYGAIMGLPQRR
jgi:glycosyltransferase involved in cell wall biosynthesis